MVLQAGKIYTPSSGAEIRDDLLTDMRLEARKYADEDEVDRVTRPGTDWHILASALGNMGMLQYANISRADEDMDDLTATGDALDRIRDALGLPEVPPSPSAGTVVVPFPDGLTATFNNHEFVFPNGKRGKINGVFVGLVGAHPAVKSHELPAISIDTGEDVNFPTDTVIQFITPPLGIGIEAEVGVPMTGGFDEEDDERKRERIRNRRRNVPAGGNWGHVIEVALNSLATAQYCFVYPALGGPGSARVVAVKDFDTENFDFSRALSSGAIQVIRNAIHAELPTPMEMVVGTVADENVDVAVKATIPDSSLSGGNGTGWLDSVVWPPLSGGDTKVTVTNVLTTDGLQIRVNASTAVSPVAGQTHIAWWSMVDMKFHTRLVTAVAGSAGAWDLTLEAPLVDHNNTIVQVGEYISPAAVNMEEYGKSWIEATRKMGPGENTTDVNRLPRAKRRPFISESWPSDLTAHQLIVLTSRHTEIQNIDWSFRSATTPTVPGSVATVPNVLRPRHFGVYKIV